ncbi:MAG: hypothetical protein ACOYLQ_17805 [Hyphomicrobiaceae bacterium]
MRNPATLGALLSIVGALLAGCTHDGFGSVTNHYASFQVPAPTGNSVHVCHAYGCQMKTKLTFTATDIAELSKLMAKTKKADTAAEERRAVAYAVGWMEVRAGNAIGTSSDRPGMDFAASGDPTQQDCVDEATNTTSYLNVLVHNGLIKHHTVGIPFSKENLLRGVSGWTHWTAVLQDTSTGQRWAVDSWIYANGENPAVVEVEKWYIEDLASLPKSLR